MFVIRYLPTSSLSLKNKKRSFAEPFLQACGSGIAVMIFPKSNSIFTTAIGCGIGGMIGNFIFSTYFNKDKSDFLNIEQNQKEEKK